MGFIDCASFASIWRGYEYYKEGMVLTFEEQADGNVQGLVKGSEGNIYSTVIDPYHPRKSSCDCPHAEGKRKVCKHKIALYFARFPEEAELYYQEVMRNEQTEETRREELCRRVTDRVNKMKKEELKSELLYLLFGGPEWQLDRFVRENLSDFK